MCPLKERCRFPELTVDAPNCSRIRIAARLAQMRENARNDAPNGRAVNSRINSIGIAQGLLQSMPLCFEQDKLVASFNARECDCDPKLERHVESHRQSHPTQVMDRNRTRANKAENTNQPAVTLFRHLKDRMRHTAKRNERTYQGNKQRLITLVERDVQEDTLPVGFPP